MKHHRPYQLTAVDCVFSELEKVDSTVLHQATGTGKTVEIAEIIRRAQPSRVLVLAHRRVLVTQAHDKIEKFGGVDVEIEMGFTRAQIGLFKKCGAVVSSVQSQTQGRRFRPDDFDYLIIDECHHCKPGNKSYMDVINHYKKNPKLKIIGVTATLEPACMKVFKTVAFTYGIQEGIKEGFLTDIEQVMVTVKGLDYSHIKTVAGDLNSKQLAAVVEKEAICQGMVMGTLETMFGVEQHSLLNLKIEDWGKYLFSHGTPKRNLIFTVSVDQAIMMSDILNRVSPGISEWVCGDENRCPEKDRLRIAKEFEKGKLLIVCNCQVYSEGYDNPTIEMITMARPTKSRTLFTQQIGRGTRTLEGIIDGIETAEGRLAAIAASAKKKLLVLDFVGNCGKHKLITATDIVADGIPEDVRIRARKKAEKSGKPQNVTQLLQEAKDELDEEKAQRERAEQARRQHVVAKSTYVKEIVSAFDKLGVRYEKATWWDRKNGRVFTPNQRMAIKNAGVDDPDSISFRCGMKLLGALSKGPPSDKQAGYLRWVGYSEDELSKLTKKSASVEIDKCKSNGNKRPTNGHQTKHVPLLVNPPIKKPAYEDQEFNWDQCTTTKPK